LEGLRQQTVWLLGGSGCSPPFPFVPFRHDNNQIFLRFGRSDQPHGNFPYSVVVFVGCC
jgi:hypothetical protein